MKLKDDYWVPLLSLSKTAKEASPNVFSRERVVLRHRHIQLLKAYKLLLSETECGCEPEGISGPGFVCGFHGVLNDIEDEE